VDVSATTVLGIGITKSLPHFGIATHGELDSFTRRSFDRKTQNKIKKLGYKGEVLLGFIMDNGDKLIAIRKPSMGGDIKSIGFKGTNNYVKMWKDKEVYDTSIKFTEKSTFMYQ
jgi:hypothetical protein